VQTHNRIDRISADTPSSRGSELLFTKRHSTEPDTGRVQKNGLAPPSALESAIVLFLPAGAYSAIVQRAGGSTGVGLVEIYDLD
jgi:hypothetical protein